MDWKDLIKKSEWQSIKTELKSISVLVITIVSGYKLFKIDNTIYSPAGIAGSILVGLGVLYSFVSFFTINSREQYKDIISEYKTTIKEMRANYKAMQKGHKESLKYGTEGTYASPENYKSQIEDKTSDEWNIKYRAKTHWADHCHI